MGPFAGLSKTHSPLLGYKESTDALRDNLYLLLNRDKLAKLLMIITLPVAGAERADRANQHPVKGET
jgi:hypothetical protein